LGTDALGGDEFYFVALVVFVPGFGFGFGFVLFGFVVGVVFGLALEAIVVVVLAVDLFAGATVAPGFGFPATVTFGAVVAGVAADAIVVVVPD
jgi:hypothetical protein